MTPRVEVIRTGHEGEPVVVVDGFAPDPDRLVAEASAADLAAASSHYPGVRAPVGPRYCDQVGPLLAAAARNVFGCRETLAFERALFSLTTTRPADLTLAQRMPHIDDTAVAKLAVVHYLAHRDWGGTSFFRHRSTGFEAITPERHQHYLDALAGDVRRLGAPAAGYIAGDSPLFDCIGTIAPVYNRAVIYRSRLLHCAAIPNDRDLPADPRSGRLTVASFLDAR